jgi:hypothetical protein
MALKISNSSLFKKHYLSVDSDGVQFYDTSVFGAKRARFIQIEYVLMSADHKLCFQAGTDVFSIPTDPANAEHQKVIKALVQEVQRSAGRAT